MKKLAINSSFVLAFLLITVGCKEEEKTPTTTEINEASSQLNNWFQEQWDTDIDFSPMSQTYLGIKKDYDKWDDISNGAAEIQHKRTKIRLTFLKDSVDDLFLDEATKLSYKLSLQQAENEVADYKYRLYNYPVHQMRGTHTQVPSLLINMHQISDEKDAQDYISRLNGVPKLFDLLLINLQEREDLGIIPPKFVFPKAIESSKNILKGIPFEKSPKESTLLADFSGKIKALNISEERKISLQEEAKKALLNSIQPAYEKLISFLENQSQQATTDHGVWKFPEGEAFFNTALQRTTTTNMTSDEIHELGLAEVKRIHSEMVAIKEKVNFKGDLKAFFKFTQNAPQFYYPDTKQGRIDYMDDAVAIIDSMRTRLDELFLTKPEANIKVKQVEAFREKSAGKAFYQSPALDGSRPGTYYANLYDIKAMPTYQMEALAYHEGIPGHHMQRAIAQELEGVPMFRKFGPYTAYTEGWGLYTELIPKEMGFYSDPYSDFGRLSMELWRACRLVVDTGIHAKKWTRQQGIDYYLDNTPDVESAAIKMVERHIVMPSQATAYKIGMNKILDLRKKAKNQLGDKFDIRQFHDVVLTNGPLPLNVLEDLVDAWVDSKI